MTNTSPERTSRRWTNVEAGDRQCGEPGEHTCLPAAHTPATPVVTRSSLRELCVDDVWVLLPLVLLDPHLRRTCQLSPPWRTVLKSQTFLKVLSPARMLPPVHVVYIRSGGARILMRMSLTASRCTSCSSLLPKPFVNVDPPDSTMLPYSDLRRSMSVRWIASTTIWCTPGYSSPMISGLNRISGARKRSAPT